MSGWDGNRPGGGMTPPGAGAPPADGGKPPVVPFPPAAARGMAKPGAESYWRVGAQQAPTPPDDLRRKERKRRLNRSKGAGGLARFFTRQVLWFLFLALVLVIVDVILYMVIAVQEMDRNYLFGTPASVTSTTSDQLALGENGYELAQQAADELDAQGAWAQLIGPDGAVLWSRNVPETATEPEAVSADGPADPSWGAVPSSYTLNQVALIAHYHALNGYPAFLWERDDGLLLVGFPAGSYETVTVTWPQETWRTLPGYILGIIGLDLLILFGAYLVSRRRTQRAVGPIGDALEDLSHGKRTQVDLRGDLQPIADRINEASDILESKDRAREQWIRGVSHDIRTPLSLIIAKADALASAPEAAGDVQAEARTIRTQGMKIKDLVADLNAASQLAFGENPLNLERIHLPKLLRACAAGYLNSHFDELHPLEFRLGDSCTESVVLGDERMLTRLVENLLANARLHNPNGCRIDMELLPARLPGGPGCLLQVADHGVGAMPEEMAALEARLARARVAPDDAVPDDAGHGLGLVLVDRIARAHGGAFEAQATPGGGFTACVTLPLA